MKELPITPEVQALRAKWKELDSERTKIWDRRKKDYKAVEVQQNRVVEEIEKLVAAQAKEILAQEGFVFDDENKYVTSGGCAIYIRPGVSIWSVDFYVGYDLSTSQHVARYGANSLFKPEELTIQEAIEKANTNYVECKKVENKNATNAVEFYQEVKDEVTSKEYSWREEKNKEWQGNWVKMEFNNSIDKWNYPSIEVTFRREEFNVKITNCNFDVTNKEDALKIWGGFKKFIEDNTEYTIKKGGD